MPGTASPGRPTPRYTCVMQVTFGGAGRRRGSSAHTCAAVLLDTSLQVVRVLRREIRRRRPADLSITQIRGLGFVNGTPDASLSDLSDHIGLTLAATSRLAATLARRGLIKQRIHPADRRFSMLRLTPRGRAHLATAFRAAHAHFAGLLAQVSPRDRVAIIRTMRIIQPLVKPLPRTYGRKAHAR